MDELPPLEYQQPERQPSSGVSIPKEYILAGGCLAVFLFFFMSLAVCVGAWFMWPSDRGGGADDVIVSPTGDIAGIVEAATLDYNRSLGEAMDAIAAKVADGTVTSREQLKANVQPFTKHAREQSFRPIDEIDNSNIPSGEWDDAAKQKVVSYLREKAKGHRKAAK